MYEKVLQTLVKKTETNMEHIGGNLREVAGRQDGMYFKDGFDTAIPLSHIFNWMQSFITGEACLAYHVTKDEKFLRWNYQYYQDYYDKVFKTPFETMHDTGFLYTPYAVAMYDITGDPKMKEIGVKAADELAKRFNPKGGYIRAWGRMDDNVPPYVDEELAKNHFFTESKGLAIVDCMMNIPLLFWASKVTGHPYYARVAEIHADTTLKYFVRDDDSVCHAWRFNEETGESLGEENYCGFGIGSHWSRGTAWAIYGFAIAYDYTKKPEYLDATTRLATKFLELCGGKVPIWDFRLPKETPAIYCGKPSPEYTWDITNPENRKYVMDSSAAAITVCGIYEILRHEKNEFLEQGAESLLKDVCERYFDPDPTVPGMIHTQNGTGHYAAYGDYYFMEALTMKQYGVKRIW